MPTWPATVPFFNSLPAATRTGPLGTTQRTSMDQGPDKVRRTTSAGVKKRAAKTHQITAGQLAVIESFFAVDLAMGALSFQAVDPFDGALRTFRFTASYLVARSGPGYIVSADLEILP